MDRSSSSSKKNKAPTLINKEVTGWYNRVYKQLRLAPPPRLPNLAVVSCVVMFLGRSIPRYPPVALYSQPSVSLFQSQVSYPKQSR